MLEVATEEAQQNAELRQAFLRQLPRRLDAVRARGRRLGESGWDINALILLHEELGVLAGACGRYGQIELSEQLHGLELVLAPCVEEIVVPDATLCAHWLAELDALNDYSGQSGGTGLGFDAGQSEEQYTTDGIALQVIPPPEFIAQFAKPIRHADEPATDLIGAALSADDAIMPALDAPLAAEPPEPVLDVPGIPSDAALPSTAAAVAPNATASLTVSAASAAARNLPRAEGQRVYFLTDGNALSGELAQRLDAQGVQLEMLDSADELREMIRALTPNLVLVDVAFAASMDAIGQTVRSVRARASQKVALMFLSESGDVAERLRAMRAGADSFLTVPVGAGEVLTRISELLAADSAEPFRVMIIEDDRSQALFAESILRKAGMVTVAVIDPLSALDTLDEFDPELILMDLYMPNCDGMELTALIRERERFLNTPIVFLSGEHDEDKRFDALSVGGDDYLEKPIRPKYLISAVTNRVRRARQLNRRMQTQTPRDAASGLYDRAYVIEQVGSALASAEPGTNLGGVLFMIIDGAHAIRERIGLSAFDTLMTHAGALIAGLITGTDFAARYGDTSFLILCPGRGEQALVAFGEEVRVRFEKHVFEIADKSLTLAVSVGISTFAQGWHETEAMINGAERAAAQARSAPERKARLFEAAATARNVSEAELLANEIADALKHDRFQLLFQPIASLRGAGEEQFQVLLRLRTPGGRLYNAAEIIPAAERAGTINALDRWVLSRCMMVLAERERTDRPVRLFVSQSIDAILDPQRLGWVAQQIAARHLNAAHLVLEFRHAELLQRLRQAAAFTSAARQLGVKIGVTAFEGNAESYQMLQHFAVDYLKVAAKYVERARFSRELSQELQQLVSFAHERKVRTIAPLVENAQTAAALWSAGVDFIQGDFVQEASADLDFDFSASAI
jgi:diguanylate cyclase (GGDEF)-like protein